MTDFEALKAAAVTTWELARKSVFPGGDDELLKDLPKLTLEGASFRIEFRLQIDVLGWASDRARTMIALRFAPAGQRMPESPWTLYVRGHWPDRQDRLTPIGPLSAGRLRKAFSPKRRPQEGSRPNPLMSDHVYLMPTAALDDLTAQLCLFVLQTESSREDDEVFAWLENHLAQTYCRKLRNLEDVPRDMLVRLIGNKWRTEDARAWRKYVAAVRRAVARQHFFQQAAVVDDLADPSATEASLIQAIEGKTDGEGARSPIESPSSPLDNPAGTWFTVEQASRRLGVSRSSVYSWIQNRRIVASFERGRFLIHQSELERLVGTRSLKAVIAAVAGARPCSLATARRHVSRLRERGCSLEDILRQPRKAGVGATLKS